MDWCFAQKDPNRKGGHLRTREQPVEELLKSGFVMTPREGWPLTMTKGAMLDRRLSDQDPRSWMNDDFFFFFSSRRAAASFMVGYSNLKYKQNNQRKLNVSQD